MNERTYRAAGYLRLSREDGDKAESDSIGNQQRLIEDFCATRPEMALVGFYADDGCTGTNFDRPAFRRLLSDIEAGRVDLVIVKDLSRFGRDYIDTGYYLERYFPARGVRFIAVNDHEDSLNGPYNLMLPLKNVFNTQYARDISEKVRSALRTRQRRGAFVGAFASYGYIKDPEDHSRLLIDPAAAEVVRGIFRRAAAGVGQLRIARELNEAGVPCPSAYKRLMGLRYRNGQRLPATDYWTYATVHRLLKNRMYLGEMVQGRSHRQGLHGPARQAEPSEWVTVPGTHAAIVSRELWDTVQAQLGRHSRDIDFSGNLGLFSGLLRCGECGRSLCKQVRGGVVSYACGSYRRSGTRVCTPHRVRQDTLTEIILEDLNRVLTAADDLPALLTAAETPTPAPAGDPLTAAEARLRRLKQGAYEDYREGLLSREEYLRYRADYTRQEDALAVQRAAAERPKPSNPWAEGLLRRGRLAELDRATVANAVEVIRVFEDGNLEITYRFIGPVEEGERETG